MNNLVRGTMQLMYRDIAVNVGENVRNNQLIVESSCIAPLVGSSDLQERKDNICSQGSNCIDENSR